MESIHIAIMQHYCINECAHIEDKYICTIIINNTCTTGDGDNEIAAIIDAASWGFSYGFAQEIRKCKSIDDFLNLLKVKDFKVRHFYNPDLTIIEAEKNEDHY